MAAQPKSKDAATTRGIDHLIEVMRRLRDPQTGCPWDIKQNFATVAPYTLEETYEFLEAVELGDTQAMKEELGDVLFQVAFHAQMGAEAGLFDFDSVARDCADKMIDRHPHVFGERAVNGAGEVLDNWEKDKEAKRKQQAEAAGKALSILDGVSSALPAMTHAVKLQKRVVRVGFDWPDAAGVLEKIREELGELEHEIKTDGGKDRLEDELGDVLFVVANLARKLDIDPETALRHANRKFERRFRGVEQIIASEGRTLDDASLNEMEDAWQAVKRAEKKV